MLVDKRRQRPSSLRRCTSGITGINLADLALVLMFKSSLVNAVRFYYYQREVLRKYSSLQPGFGPHNLKQNIKWRNNSRV